MKRILLLALSFSIYSLSFAQYESSIGVMYGKEGMGLTFKKFLQPEQNIQINALYVRDNFANGGLLVGLYEFHKEIHSSTLHTTSLSWSFGGGLHAAYWMTKATHETSAIKFGIDGVLGAEYNLEFVPLTIGAQIRPYVQYNTGDLTNNNRYYNMDYALMLRYIIQ